MRLRCHLVALIVLVSLNGCILDMFFGGDKKPDPPMKMWRRRRTTTQRTRKSERPADTARGRGHDPRWR